MSPYIGEYPRGYVILPKENVIFHVRKIDFYFDIMAAIVPSEMTTVFGEYRTGEKPLYQAAAHSIVFEKQQYSFTIQKDLKNDQIKSTFIHHNLKTGEIEVISEKDGIPTKPTEDGAAYLY